ncbi:DUF4041 domain-containing protein [Nodosilinea sp. FACHB-13]|uniref:DUF4041 domain-containing protein n=1 Tax=Cyanophyceae TaxID=3028117 RepID=UPI001688DE52|nr:DUF4041 domain-containing protein [Nodosilinea sp. FACHB-13]
MGRYNTLVSKEEKERELDAKIESKKRYIESLHSRERQMALYLADVEEKTKVVEEENHLQQLGFHEPKYSFVRSEDYKLRFDQITNERKTMILSDQAVFCRNPWPLGNDLKKGEKAIRSHLRVIREAFDNICDSAIDNAKTGNVNNLKKRILRSYESLNKLSKNLECEISREYYELRIKELEVKYEMELKKEEEREQNRFIREQLKKEKKEREAIEKARKEEEEALERQTKYEQEREAIKVEMEKAVGVKLRELESRKRQYDNLISKAQEERENAVSRYRLIKSGNIYVVSNEGSFGEDIYRVFMTQSGEPEKYIKTMNPFVPFPFIIHIRAYSEDAADSLEKIQNKFYEKRINKVNQRRDFFPSSFDQHKRSN